METLTQELKRIEDIEHPGIYAGMLKNFIFKLEAEIKRSEVIIENYKRLNK